MQQQQNSLTALSMARSQRPRLPRLFGSGAIRQAKRLADKAAENKVFYAETPPADHGTISRQVQRRFRRKVEKAQVARDKRVFIASRRKRAQELPLAA